MQLEEIQIPVYFGGFIDVFWDSDGIIRVDTERDRLSICANGPALAALAKQLLYFSCNNSLRHAHVHYDLQERLCRRAPDFGVQSEGGDPWL